MGVSRSESEWEQLLREQSARGVTIKEFCRARGISKSSFYKQRMNRGGGNEFTELLPKSTTSAYEVIVNGVAVKIPSTGCATKVAGLVRALKFKREASVRGFNINLTKYFTDVFSSLSDSQHLKLTPLEWAKARAEAKDKAEAVEAAA